MTYSGQYSEKLVKKLAKLKKKEPEHYSKIQKKMEQILDNPKHKYKFLHHTMKNVQRLHLGHFVLVFRINHKFRTISFEDYAHHDNIYF